MKNAPAPPRIQVPTTDGLHLSALVEGNPQGPTVVLVHGYPDNLTVWDDVVEALKADFRIIRYDVRGAGLSQAPRGIRGYRLQQLLADFRRVIDQLSPDTQVHLIGHDWGSVQGWEFATEPALRGRILGYTTFSGPCLDHIGYAVRHAGITPRQLAPSWYVGAFHLPLLGSTLWRLAVGRRWPDFIRRLEGQRVPVNPHQVRDGVNGINLYRANVLPRAIKPRQRTAIAPVQLLVAAKDPFVKAHLLAGIERWAPQLERAEIDAGHWLPLTQPQWLAERIREFNTRLLGAAA